MKLSVIIPTCNRDALLLECLESLLPQTYAGVEVVVVNNGDNNHLELPRTILDRVKVVRTRPRIGASNARNVGAGNSHGDYIAFLDDDDFWAPDYIQYVVEYLDRNEVDLLITNKVIYRDGQYFYKRKEDFDSSVDFNDVFLKKYSIGGQAMVASRKTFLDVGGFNPEFKSSNDKALVMDFLIRGYNVRAYYKPEAYFRQHVADIRLTDQPFRGGLKFFKKYYRYMTPSIRVRLLAKLGVALVSQLRNKLVLMSRRHSRTE